MVRAGYIATALSIILIAVYLFVYRADARTLSAETIIASCAQESDHEACYTHAVPKLYPQYSVPDIFDIIRIIRSRDTSYQYCHVLAHQLGEAVVAQDPAHWIDAIPLNPTDGLCSNGFIHGVIVGRFRNDVLDEAQLKDALPDFKKACEPHDDWRPSGLDQAMCYHGMGHLFMFITQADITRSLSLCANITESPTGDFGRVCREGVFMQIYQPLEPDDFALLKLLPEQPTAENYRRLCAAYDPRSEGACLREAWPLFRTDIMDGVEVEHFCDHQPSMEEQNNCYDTVFSIIGRTSLNDHPRAVRACGAVPHDRHATCLAAAAQAILEEDRAHGKDAIALCTMADVDDALQCEAALAQKSGFIFPDAATRSAFCALMPAALRSACREN